MDKPTPTAFDLGGSFQLRPLKLGMTATGCKHRIYDHDLFDPQPDEMIFWPWESQNC